MFISNVLSQSKTWIIFTQPIFNWSIFTQHIKRFVKMAKGYKVDIVYMWSIYKSKYEDIESYLIYDLKTVFIPLY